MVINILTLVTMIIEYAVSFSFLWFARIKDLVGTIFTFVGIAILLGTVLMTIGIFNRVQK